MQEVKISQELSIRPLYSKGFDLYSGAEVLSPFAAPFSASRVFSSSASFSAKNCASARAAIPPEPIKRCISSHSY